MKLVHPISSLWVQLAFPGVVLAAGLTFVPVLAGSYDGPPGTMTVDDSKISLFSGNCSVEGRLVQAGKVFRFTPTRTDGTCAELGRIKIGKVCATIEPSASMDGGRAGVATFRATDVACKPFNGRYKASD